MNTVVVVLMTSSIAFVIPVVVGLFLGTIEGANRVLAAAFFWAVGLYLLLLAAILHWW